MFTPHSVTFSLCYRFEYITLGERNSIPKLFLPCARRSKMVLGKWDFFFKCLTYVRKIAIGSRTLGSKSRYALCVVIFFLKVLEYFYKLSVLINQRYKKEYSDNIPFYQSSFSNNFDWIKSTCFWGGTQIGMTVTACKQKRKTPLSPSIQLCLLHFPIEFRLPIKWVTARERNEKWILMQRPSSVRAFSLCVIQRKDLEKGSGTSRMEEWKSRAQSDSNLSWFS